MSGPRDDDLREMLEARADRLPDGTWRRVMAAVRDEMGAPRSRAASAVLPDSMRGRGPMAPAGWAAVALVAALVLAVTGGRLDLGTHKPAAMDSPTAASAFTVVPTEPATPGTSPKQVESASPATPALTMTAGQLRDALEAGSLDRQLVLIDGALEVVLGRCSYSGPSPGPVPTDCFAIAIRGIDSVAVTWDGTLTPEIAASMQGVLAFTVRGPSLVFEGRIAGEPARGAPARPLTLQELLDRRGLATAAAQRTLTWIDGWLVVGGVHTCPALGPEATACPGPRPALTDKEPLAEGIMTGDLQVPVDVGEVVPGFVPGRIVTPGPFLVRMVRDPGCSGLDGPNETACLSVKPVSVHIVARRDPAIVVRVTPVRSACALPGSGVMTTLTCGAALAAALDVVPAGTSVIALEFSYGGGCPPWVRCAYGLASPYAGHVVVDVAPPGRDLWVVVTADDAGVVTAAQPIPFPAWWGETPTP